MEDLNSLRVVDLKEKLKELDLPVSGKKAELIERLSEALKASVRDVKQNSQLLSEDHTASGIDLTSVENGFDNSSAFLRQIKSEYTTLELSFRTCRKR